MQDGNEMTAIRGRILFVDDSADVAAAYASLARAAGYFADTASDGCQGLAMFTSALWRGQPYDTVVSDVEMPRMNGFEMARSIRGLTASHGLASVRLVCVSGSADEVSARKAGFDLVFEKPCSFRVLLGAVGNKCAGVPVAREQPPSKA